MKKIVTLCLVHTNSQVLLGYKKRGFGAGRWNGFGGKVEENESVVEAARRELQEESGLTADTLEQKAVIYFFDNEPGGGEHECYVFEVREYSGEVRETEEMRPQWFYESEIPYDKMWPDDRFWFPYFLAGKKFVASFTLKNQTQVLDYKITEMK